MNTRPVMELAHRFILARIVRWSSWPLLFFLLVFFVTGYAMSGGYGFGRLLDAKTALAIHKLCHLPLFALMLVHSLPAMYLEFHRWGWFGRSNGP